MCGWPCAAPRSARVTKLLDDGTLIVRGQEVGRVDPRAAKDGQLPVPVRHTVGVSPGTH